MCERLLVVLDRISLTRAGHDPLEITTDLLEAGVRRFWYRDRDPDDKRLIQQARRLVEAITPHRGELYLSDRGELAVELGAAGIQCSSRGLTVEVARERWPSVRIGCSCHNLDDLRRAERAGADYLTLSPIFETIARKDSPRPALGLDYLARGAATITIPIFALGGIRPENVQDCLEHGAHGVATLGAITAAAHPATVAQGFLRALSHHHERTN